MIRFLLPEISAWRRIIKKSQRLLADDSLQKNREEYRSFPGRTRGEPLTAIVIRRFTQS